MLLVHNAGKLEVRVSDDSIGKLKISRSSALISMKLFKLWVHQQNFSEDELIINPKEFPYENVGDILEIHHPDEGNTRLLLQIKSISPDFQQKDTISIEQSVANIFQLRTYWDVEVTKVEPKDVSVNMVEVLLKDQFVARSEMWRFSKDLVGSCVYVNKKLKHSGVRAQVNEIWCKGEKVSCGVISKDTRVSGAASEFNAAQAQPAHQM